MSAAGELTGQVYDHLVKLLLIGDSGVGKSCLLLRYSEASFSHSFVTTIGIDFKVKSLVLQGKRVKLQIWDTAGQERFRTITTGYYRGAMGIVLVYDVTDERSFSNVKNWIKQIDLHAAPEVHRVLVANKIDVEPAQRVISKARGQKLASEYEIPYFETSAKSNVNVDELFQFTASAIIERLEIQGDFMRRAGGVKLTSPPPAPSAKSCCP